VIILLILMCLLTSKFFSRLRLVKENVVKKYHNYAVKKASDDVGVIEQFMSKYSLKVEQN